MLAAMTPLLTPGRFHFCSSADQAIVAAAIPSCLGLFCEEEGTTLILCEEDAERFGFARTLPMARITLAIFSALDGVGLTAGVATALARADIPCNMVAAYHHDHVFVPEPMAAVALAILRALQEAAASPSPAPAPERGM